MSSVSGDLRGSDELKPYRWCGACASNGCSDGLQHSIVLHLGDHHSIMLHLSDQHSIVYV